VSVKWNKS